MKRLAIGVAWRDRASLWPAFAAHMCDCEAVFQDRGLLVTWIVRGELPHPTATMQGGSSPIDLAPTQNVETWAVRRDILASPTVKRADYFTWHDNDDWHDPHALCDACEVLSLEEPRVAYAYHRWALRASRVGTEILGFDERLAPSPSMVVFHTRDALMVPYASTDSGKGDRSGSWTRLVCAHARERGEPQSLNGLRAVFFSHGANTSPGNKVTDRGDTSDRYGLLPAAAIPLWNATALLEP